MKRLLFIILIFLFSAMVQAQIKGEPVSYNDGEVELEGYFAYDKLLKSKRGGVLLIHDVNGKDEFIQERAKELAKAGYIVLAIDMYGKGVLAKSKEESVELSEPFLGEDRQLMRHRASLGLEILANHKKVDSNRLAAAGFGFGGITALELARDGANIHAAVNFFGSLSTPTPQNAANIKGAVLVLLGSEDPKISPEEISAFRSEMLEASVDWQMFLYGGAVSGYSYYDLGFEVVDGRAYHYNADKRSWENLKTILREKLK